MITLVHSLPGVWKVRISKTPRYYIYHTDTTSSAEQAAREKDKVNHPLLYFTLRNRVSCVILRYFTGVIGPASQNPENPQCAADICQTLLGDRVL